MTDYLIDISSWQGTSIGWSAVRDHNISGCSVKVTESDDYTNPAADSQIDGARSVGIAVGGYHFAQPGNVSAQVDHFVANLLARGLLDSGSLWPMLDMEADGFGDPNAWIAEFIRLYRERSGRRQILVYANQNWFTTMLRPDEWADDDVILWCAQYNGDPGTVDYAHPRLGLHQHTSKGRVNGFAGNVDRNVTMPGWSLGAMVLDGAPAPDPGHGQPDPIPPADWTSYTVIRGDTLTGIAARYRTTVAALAYANGIPDPNVIGVGQVLRVPGSGGHDSGEAYQIQPGDTLSALAARWDTTVAAIATRNNIANPNRIRAGAWLVKP